MYARQREHYPDNWEEMSLWCRVKAKWKCEWCGIAEGTWRIGCKRAYQVHIQAAHLDQDSNNPSPRLIALCQRCHLRYDGMEHGKKMQRTKNKKRVEKQINSGQLLLLELERIASSA